VGDVEQPCFRCSAGTFSAGGLANETECAVCADGTTSDAGSTNCTIVCEQNFFSTGGAPCQACPDNTTNVGPGSANCPGAWQSTMHVLLQPVVLHNVAHTPHLGGEGGPGSLHTQHDALCLPVSWSIHCLLHIKRVCVWCCRVCHVQCAILASSLPMMGFSRPVFSVPLASTRMFLMACLAHHVPGPRLLVWAQHQLTTAQVSSLMTQLRSGVLCFAARTASSFTVRCTYARLRHTHTHVHSRRHAKVASPANGADRVTAECRCHISSQVGHVLPLAGRWVRASWCDLHD
jgi:hypothetical protein